jgi:hypothetical protein
MSNFRARLLPQQSKRIRIAQCLAIKRRIDRARLLSPRAGLPLAAVHAVVWPILVDPGAEAGWAEFEGHYFRSQAHRVRRFPPALVLPDLFC